MKADTQINIRLPKDLLELFDEACLEGGFTRTSLIRRFIINFIQERRKNN